MCRVDCIRGKRHDWNCGFHQAVDLKVNGMEFQIVNFSRSVREQGNQCQFRAANFDLPIREKSSG